MPSMIAVIATGGTVLSLLSLWVHFLYSSCILAAAKQVAAHREHKVFLASVSAFLLCIRLVVWVLLLVSCLE